ncbi:MAG: hypothetical protein HYZ90_01605 [Candidatus Omnitrophica bacterium]|nr:hypothetical protein [Candidatus Omnitrophota bacterium]
MKRILQMILVVAVIGLTALSFAASESTPQGGCPVCSAAGSDSYGAKTVGQLGRGAANTGLCWTEMVNQPVKEMRSGGGNILIGMGKGVGHTCLRLVQGVGEIITSPMPKAKDGKYTQIATDCPMELIGVTN